MTLRLTGQGWRCHAVTMGMVSGACLYDVNGRFVLGLTYVYFAQARDTHPDAAMFIKIGVTNDPVHRFCALQVGCPFPITKAAIVKVLGSTEARAIEKKLHAEFAAENSSGEWFRFDWTNPAVREGVARRINLLLNDALPRWNMQQLEVADLIRIQRALESERKAKWRAANPKKRRARRQRIEY
jgi:hypothetical protein